MGSDSIYQLPAYPSTSLRKSLSPSQRATLNQTISASLLQTIALPPAKRATPAAKRFVETYAKDTALQVLQGLIWEPAPLSKDEKIIRKRTLLLAEKLAGSEVGLDFQTLLDLSIVYAPTNASKMRLIVSSSVDSDPSLIQSVQNELVPAFTQLLDYNQGLYSIRKASHCLSTFLSASPPQVVRCFAHNKPFLLHLAELYDSGLDSIATFYGRSIDVDAPNPADEWQVIFVQTKVSLLDAFHIIITTLLTDLASSSGPQLAAESEHTFDVIFALLEVRVSHPPPHTHTPYLDQSLLADYQHSYSLSHTLAAALKHASEKDARLDLLESSLAALESPSSTTTERKDPGALKILLGSSGIAPGIDNLGNGSRVRSSNSGKSKGKGKERAAPEADTDVNVPRGSHIPDIDIKITQVLDILPDHPPEYIRALLEHPPYDGNPENVVEALLEGTAPSPDGLRSGGGGETVRSVDVEAHEDVGTYVRERRNVFDEEVVDLSQMRFGKKRGEDESAVFRDRTFIEQMKADILRRAEEISSSEAEEDDHVANPKLRGSDLAFDDVDDVPAITIGGDGSSDSEGEDTEPQPQPQSVETVLEMAYIRDPKLFDRDAATRRGKARAELKERTGWGDEQIEGWRIMLERNPRKDKILQKHEFAGNQPGIAPSPSASGSRGRGTGRGRGGGGRGGRGGGGGGRGGGGGGSGEGGADHARERAWKDKNKASRGNHNRKRGHDKKMARAGAGVPPS